jgi:pSer/pThr/pTyr-binding forkhead associated (FHA) protein
MKALLVLQEGPGAGYSYPLDPFKQPVFTVGRSSGCDIALADQRASRHHGEFRWNGRHWEVVDRGSTNGTYVNGMQVHGPYDLRVGDRITVGETTMVLREFSAPAPTPARQPSPAKQRGPTMEGRALRGPAVAAPAHGARRSAQRPEPAVASSAGVEVVFWLVQGFAAAAVVCLASGAFLPWLKVTGSLSQNLQPLVQSLANVVATLSGSDSVFNLTQEIGGLQGYGKLTLGVAVIGAITLAVDVFLVREARKSVVPGIVYLLAGLVATGAMASDLINYYRYYDQIQSLSLLFGVQLADVVKVFGQFIEVKITPLIGLPLTALGLVLLLAVGAARLAATLLDRG